MSSEESRRKHRSVRGVAIGLFCVAAGCASGGSGPGDEHGAPVQVLETGAFRHDQHLAMELDGVQLSCESCHLIKQNAKFETARPGSNAHAPCDTCHATAYYEPPGKLCEVCHVSVDPFSKGKSPLREFPRQRGRASLISNFDHASHLERNKDRVPAGGQFVCEACHTVAGPESAYATFPKHETCAFCHEQVATPRMTTCTGCHVEDGPAKGRKFLGNDVRFTHGKHRSDSAEQRIDCALCHYAVVESSRAADLNLPQMKDCAKCHQNAERTPERVRISACGVCHTTDVNKVDLPGDHTASLEKPLRALWAGAGDGLPGAALVPKAPDLFPKWDLSMGLPSFLVPTQTSTVQASMTPKAMTLDDVRPEDHTPLFRRRHARAASAPDAKCSYCHAGLSGSTRDNCRECHAVSRPVTHTARWRSVDHGRTAARDPQRCATCHEVDYCTECHSITPASHFPLTSFRTAHNRSARANPRACMTCHSYDATCSRCHAGELKGSR